MSLKLTYRKSTAPPKLVITAAEPLRIVVGRGSLKGEMKQEEGG